MHATGREDDQEARRASVPQTHSGPTGYSAGSGEGHGRHGLRDRHL